MTVDWDFLISRGIQFQSWAGGGGGGPMAYNWGQNSKMPNGICFSYCDMTLCYNYGIAKCNIIFIVAVSLCLFSSHCATCLNLSYSVSNDNLLRPIAFRVPHGTECLKVNYKLSCVLWQRSPSRVSLHFLHTLYFAKNKYNSILSGYISQYSYDDWVRDCVWR